MKAIVICALALLFATPSAYPQPATRTRQNSVIARLKRALPGYADAIVADPRFAIDRSLIVKKHVGSRPHRPTKPDYDYVFSDWSKVRGPQFMETNEEVFALEEQRFRVPREFIVGILNIETQWGKALGHRPVVTTLYTLAVFRPDYQGAGWPEKQLITFLTLCRKNAWDPFKVIGSWTGAFGYPQFEPTSYPSFAVRCRDSGSPPDLFDEADAICSIGNYLRHAGWGESETSRRKALHAYIHDSVYADAVLDYADLIAHRPARNRYRFSNHEDLRVALK